MLKINNEMLDGYVSVENNGTMNIIKLHVLLFDGTAINVSKTNINAHMCKKNFLTKLYVENSKLDKISQIVFTDFINQVEDYLDKELV